LVAAPLNAQSEVDHGAELPSYSRSFAAPNALPRVEPSTDRKGDMNPNSHETQEASSAIDAQEGQALSLDAFGYLGGLFEARFYEAHGTTGNPRDEIREAASLYGVDFVMMMSIAKVESDFNPHVRTGSYKGLFQLSDYEFNKYGDGSIRDARDSARAAAHMFLVQAEKFKWALGHYPDFAERYMVHQQGIQGAIEHYSHPERAAWQSMCATDEGVLKGEKWCKKCIWGNLLPEWKRAFGNVDSIQSGDFITLWTARIDHFTDRYSSASADAVVGGAPKDNEGGVTAAASSNLRSLRSHASHFLARVALTGRRHSRISAAGKPAHNSLERRHRRA
jgi:predicted GIY-YIG superfamily endonuclease